MLRERSILMTFLSSPYLSTISLTIALAAFLDGQFFELEHVKIIAVHGVDGWIYW